MYASFIVRYLQPYKLVSLSGQPVTKRPICVDLTLNSSQTNMMQTRIQASRFYRLMEVLYMALGGSEHSKYINIG